MNCPTCNHNEEYSLTDFDGGGDPLYWCKRCGTTFDGEYSDVPTIIIQLISGDRVTAQEICNAT